MIVSGIPQSPNLNRGAQLKWKFYSTASCRVSGVNQKRSVKLAVLDSGKWIEIGNVSARLDGKTWFNVGNATIPPDKSIPKEGDIIEVRYLYAFKGGALFQTTFIGPRNDVQLSECTMDQLKFKNT